MASPGQPQLALALDFLSDAAHLLHGSAPATSAHLVRHRADAASRNKVAQHGLDGQHACAACGSIMVPGLAGTAVAVSRRRGAGNAAGTTTAASRGTPTAPRRQARAAAAPKAYKELTCGRCHGVTRISLGPPPPPAAAARRRAAKALPPVAAAATAPPATAPPSSSRAAANATSKRRAKNRKGGLQALLAGQQHGSAPSLTLADFGAT